jgi:hypothetical protein
MHIYFHTGLLSRGTGDICLFFKIILNTLVEDVSPYGCLSLLPLFYESLSTDMKFPQVLECGFYPSTQRRGMSSLGS